MKLERKITVVNMLGLHARAASKLVKLTSSFKSDIKIRKQAQEIDAKSILGVMMLAATRGTDLQLVIEGDDAQSACNAIIDLFEGYFGEEG